jgi:hypothetical protein
MKKKCKRSCEMLIKSSTGFYHTPTQMAMLERQMTSAGVDVKKLEHL